MSFIRHISLICIVLLCSLASFAQAGLASQNLSTVNIDKVSDEDIKAYYEKAVENGITDDKLYEILVSKGMPDEEIDKLKDRIASLPLTAKRSTEITKAEKGKDNFRMVNDDAFKTPMKKTKESDLSVFGSELFEKNSLVFEPNLRIATPAGYILGPDDELIVNVFGFSEKTYNLSVSAEGNVYIPQIGPVFVNGLSIEQASAKIKAKMASTIYKAMKSGQTNVQISLGKIRSIRATVIGEAKKPGTYTISSLTTLFNLLYLCGGPSDMGSYRHIELIRGNEVKRVIDLYGFLLKGDQKDNVLLKEGDIIRIPYYTKRVVVNGNVKHKGKYEVVDGETFNNVLSFCGGFADDAYRASVSVYQLTDKERKILDVAKDKYGSYFPQSSDSIVAGKLLNRFENKLTIKGAVMRPGEYELNNGTTLKELIERAGGVKEDVYTKRGIISRLNYNRTPTQISFNVDSILNGLQTVMLSKDDSVTVYSIFDLRNEGTVSIDGYIKKPGTYKWVENITLKDLVLTAGGPTEFGDLKNIEVARRIKNADISKSSHTQSEIIKVDLSDSSANDVVLQPYDAINVRQQPGYVNQRTVYVDGMVVNPGRYTLKTNSDRIRDIMKRVGGFRANADTASVVIKRYSAKPQSSEDREKIFSKLLNIKQDSILSNERIKNEIYKNYDVISVNLSKAMQDPNGSENMPLEDGDIISVERNTNLVKVSGDVYFPTMVPYKRGAGLRYYVQKSGSYTSSARKSGTLVIYPDGNAKKVKHFLFFKFNPSVTSRCEIYVPQKAVGNRSKISTGEWALIVSALGIVANTIISARK